MSKRKSIQSLEQLALIDELRSLGKETLEAVWDEDGKLHEILNQSYLIQQAYVHNSEDNIDPLEAGPLRLVRKRIEALKDPAKFFKGMVKCHSLITAKSDEDDENSLTLGYLAPEDYPEHFAWAIDILLHKFFRGRKNNLNALVERFKNADYHDAYTEVLLANISPTDIARLSTMSEQQADLNSRLLENANSISDFEFLNNSYGLSHLVARESDDADCLKLPYYDYNIIVSAYVDTLEDDNLLKEIFARLISFTDYEATVNCLTQHSAFDIALFDHETLLKQRLKELNIAEEEEEIFKELNRIEERAISLTLKKIAEYRYSNFQEQKLADTYDDINEIFTSLLEGEINEIEFQVNLETLITKFQPGTDFLTKIVAYVTAIVNYITNNDRETLPRYWHLDELKAYKGEFAENFISYLNKLSHTAKKEFLTEYASKLELKLNPNSNSPSANNSTKSDSTNEDKATDKSESAEENNTISISSQASSKASFWFKRCKEYNGEEDISVLIREAETIERAIASAAA